MKKLITASFLSFVFSIQGVQSRQLADLIPKLPLEKDNNAILFESLRKESVSVNEQDFFHMLMQIELIYIPIFQKLDKQFIIKKLWDSQLHNSESYLHEDQFAIMVHGGLARHRSMTIDSLALVACHEIGHYLGGAPSKMYEGEKSWASVEGQADYFATAKCLKRLFTNRSENRAAYNELKPSVKEEIQLKCNTYLCARIVAAGLALAKTVEALEGEVPSVKISGKDRSVVKNHLEDHPTTQCRLDTFVAGAACNVPVNEDFDAYDLSAGACVKDSLNPEEVKAARPLCWFVPDLR